MDWAIRKMQMVEVLWALLQEGALRVAREKLVLGAEAGALWGQTLLVMVRAFGEAPQRESPQPVLDPRKRKECQHPHPKSLLLVI